MKHKLIQVFCLLLASTLLFSNVIKANETQIETLGCFHEDEDGLNTWLSGVNPYIREMYGGYERDGHFYIYTDTTKTVQYATHISCFWKSNGVGQKYLLEDGTWLEKTSDMGTREYIETSGNFVLLRDCSEYTQPFFDKTFLNGNVLPKGTYKALKVSVDYVQLEKPDGTHVWVVPQYTDEDVFIAECMGYFVDSLDTLSVENVNGVPIKEMLMPIRADKRSGIAMQPQYVTIHNTGNEGKGANAYVHAYNQIHDNRTNISWHFTVDNKEIYQSMLMNEVGFHCGDGLNIGNGASIGIEICENVDGNYAQAEKNAAYLTAQILFEHKLPSDAVRMHKDWSGKNCAQNILEGTEGTMGWNAFKELVKQEYDRLVEETKNSIEINKSIPEGFEAYIETHNYVFKDGNTTGYQVGMKVEDLITQLQAIDSTATISIKNADGSDATGVIATGNIVVIVKKDLSSFAYNIIIKGDVNGDGNIFATDYVRIKNYIMGTGTLSDISKCAADVNGDGNVFATDYVKIKNHIMGKGMIVQ